MANRLAMSRLAVLLVLLLSGQMVGGPVQAAPQLTVPGTTRYTAESVAAQWIIPTKVEGEFEWIVVRVVRRTSLDSNKVRLFGSAGVGSCSTHRDGALSCGAEVHPHRVTKFEADSASRSVNVRLRSGKKRYYVAWTSDHPYGTVPPAATHPEPCPSGKMGTLTEIYVLTQRAKAEGRIFGRRVSTAAEPEQHREPEDITEKVEIKDCS